MLRLASLIRCAIIRRSPMTLISSVGARVSGERARAEAGLSAPPWRRAIYLLQESVEILTHNTAMGPDPGTFRRSIPASCARRRIAGEVATRPLWWAACARSRHHRRQPPPPAATTRPRHSRASPDSARPRSPPCRRDPPLAGGWAPPRRTRHPPPYQTQSTPHPPAPYPRLPGRGHHSSRTGEGSSTAAFSVITSTMTSSSDTYVSRLYVPGDDLRLYRALTEVGQLEYELTHAASMTLFSAAAIRAGPGNIPTRKRGDRGYPNR